MATSITLRQQAWPWRMTTASNAAGQARGSELRPGVTGMVLSGNGDGLLRPARDGLGRIRDLTVTSLVTSQHQRHADLRESGI